MSDKFDLSGKGRFPRKILPGFPPLIGQYEKKSKHKLMEELLNLREQDLTIENSQPFHIAKDAKIKK